jgi:putative addiction module killer protein
MAEIEILEFVDEEGTNFFRQWIGKLDPASANKVAFAVLRMASGNFADHKSAGQGVLECRLHFGPGYRIYFGRDGERIVILLGGGTKRRQEKDIEHAQRAWQHYKVLKQTGAKK